MSLTVRRIGKRLKQWGKRIFNPTNMLSIPLTAGSVIAVGALSVVGTLTALPTAAAFILFIVFGSAGFVDGQVYWQNLYNCIRCLVERDYLAKALLRQRLREMMESTDAETSALVRDNLFLEAYALEHRRVAALRKAHSSLTFKEEEELEKREKRLKSMESFLLKRLRKFIAGTRTEDENKATRMEKAVERLFSHTINGRNFFEGLLDQGERWGTISKKKWQLRLGLFISAGAGACSFFVTAAACEQGLLLLGLTFSGIPGGIVIAISAFAAVGYCLLMYQSCYDVLVRGLVSQWLGMVIGQAHGQAINLSRSIIVYLAAIFTIALFFVATVFTAGTWFYLMKDGVSLFGITSLVASILQFAFNILMAIPTLLFNMANVMDASEILMNLFHNGWDGLRQMFVAKVIEPMREAWRDENFVEIFNPFRIVAKIVAFVLFVAHVVADALASDGFLDEIASTVVGSVNNTLVDLPYMIDIDSDESKPNEPKAEEGQDQKLSSESKVEAIDELKKHLSDSKHESHSHFFQNILLLPTNLVGIFVWDLFLGGLYYLIATLVFGSSVKAPNFDRSWEKFYGKSAVLDAETDLSVNNSGSLTPQQQEARKAWFAQEVIATVEADMDGYSEFSQCVSAMMGGTIQAKNKVKMELVELVREVEEHKDASASNIKAGPHVVRMTKIDATSIESDGGGEIHIASPTASPTESPTESPNKIEFLQREEIQRRETASPKSSPTPSSTASSFSRPSSPSSNSITLEDKAVEFKSGTATIARLLRNKGHAISAPNQISLDSVEEDERGDIHHIYREDSDLDMKEATVIHTDLRAVIAAHRDEHFATLAARRWCGKASSLTLFEAMTDDPLPSADPEYDDVASEFTEYGITIKGPSLIDVY